ncbi:helix-turn-helix domain-containing protein [Actinomadura rupiterrae]|uniref:helix-turn-helix domain-containing protein n=1 Tax=Actinomadura rupiterrae TaxID=559627 RepID=UPI0020A2DE9D|nr:helix-turn-helix transcriptional regulator [Actinomadura rupiterrae]MCP2336679.1 DNA-binding CsgD family transcriptional regulator [Actinomadura rupiterrae]
MHDADLSTHLCRLGLSRPQAEIYLALLATGPGDAVRLAKELGRAPDDVPDVARRLGELRSLGLVTAAGTSSEVSGASGTSGEASGTAGTSSEVSGTSGTSGEVAVTSGTSEASGEGGAGTEVEHAPVEPSIALEHLAHARTAELRRAHLAAANAYRDYRRSVSPQATHDLVEVVTGTAIAERIWNIEEAVESSVLRFDSPPYHTRRGANPVEIENLARGVEYRVVYSKSAVEDSAYYGVNIRPCVAAGEKARVLPAVPVKLTVFDGRLALVSMSFVEAEVNDSLLLVHPSSLLSALIGLFETSWRVALPMHRDDRAPAALNPMQRRILELLATGVTDETIAELLGISRRTLSRHLEQLNTRAGSLSRFQLALHAARNGWL